MTILTITGKGQVTLKKDLLKHLGVQPGEKVDVALLPDGALSVKAVPKEKSWDSFCGMFAHKADRIHTLAEIDDAIEAGWAGEVEI